MQLNLVFQFLFRSLFSSRFTLFAANPMLRLHFPRAKKKYGEITKMFNNYKTLKAFAMKTFYFCVLFAVKASKKTKQTFIFPSAIPLFNYINFNL